ncbi:MAG: hypothetical protein H7329_16375 [Opitutaceae bacterium]|nr:hypothetical protein [Cytophagales bacterium]
MKLSILTFMLLMCPTFKTKDFTTYFQYAETYANILKLTRGYDYNDPGYADEEYGKLITLTISQKNKVKVGEVYNFPSSFIKGEYENWTAGDATNIKTFSGSFGIISINNEEIEVFIRTENTEVNFLGSYVFKFKNK